MSPSPESQTNVHESHHPGAGAVDSAEAAAAGDSADEVRSPGIDPAVDAGTADRTTPLARMPVGACGTVADVDASARDVERLKVMGLCVGRRVGMLKQGNPLVVRCVGSRLGLSRDLAEMVEVRLEAEAGDPCPASIGSE
jgi:Fe2+ transport system protein FeoA